MSSEKPKDSVVGMVAVILIALFLFYFFGGFAILGWLIKFIVGSVIQVIVGLIVLGAVVILAIAAHSRLKGKDNEKLD